MNESGKISDLNKTESLYYRTTVGDTIADAETIKEPLYSYVADWLYSKADSRS